DLSFKLVRQPLIVVIEKRDPFTSRVIDAGIACTTRRRSVRICDEPYASIVYRLNRGESILVRSVDDHDDLDLLVGLPEHAINRAQQQTRPIECRYHDRDQHFSNLQKLTPYWTISSAHDPLDRETVFSSHPNYPRTHPPPTE